MRLMIESVNDQNLRLVLTMPDRKLYNVILNSDTDLAVASKYLSERFNIHDEIVINLFKNALESKDGWISTVRKETLNKIYDLIDMRTFHGRKNLPNLLNLQKE